MTFPVKHFAVCIVKKSSCGKETFLPESFWPKQSEYGLASSYWKRSKRNAGKQNFEKRIRKIWFLIRFDTWSPIFGSSKRVPPSSGRPDSQAFAVTRRPAERPVWPVWFTAHCVQCMLNIRMINTFFKFYFFKINNANSLRRWDARIPQSAQSNLF